MMNSTDLHQGNSPRPLLECLNRRKKPFQRREKHFYRRRFSTQDGKLELGRSTVDLRLPTAEHLHALKRAFDQILQQRSLKSSSRKEKLLVANEIRTLIVKHQPNAAVQFYGSILFHCALENSSFLDLDVQIDGIEENEILQEIFSILNQNDLCRDIRLNLNEKPMCIELIDDGTKHRCRITSNQQRRIDLSKLISIYSKFDSRLIQFLRLFRIFSRICNLDKPEYGTVHPIVYHLMIIHFLQQLDPPVLPTLHEEIFGLDRIPLNLSSKEFSQFIHCSLKYSKEWKSGNHSSVELLFLQCLSYYLTRFHYDRYLVSIQTRMPILQSNCSARRKRFVVQDPMDIQRDLCQTMQSTRSFDYFRDVLNAALNYFGRKQMKQSSLPNDEELIEISPVINGKDSLHSSYRCISEKFPEELLRSSTLTQEQLREFYRTMDQSDSRCIDLSSMSSNDIDRNLDEEIFSDPIEENLEAFLKNLNKKKRRILHREYERQGNQINDKVKEIYENLSKNDEEFFYDFQRENFHAEQGAPFVCLYCNAVGHLKSQCPEFFIGIRHPIPSISSNWSNVLSSFCQHVMDRFRPTESDIEIRRKILDEVQQLLDENSFPCRVNAFGSFYNGFGFRHSDLDLSLVFPSDPSNDQNEEILKQLYPIFQRKSSIFLNVQWIPQAKVPIIRTRHRTSHIDVDISLENLLAIENTRLLKLYSDIDPRVSPLGYMIKHLAKICDINDASRGTLSSYAYLILLIHFLQQIQPPVLPVLQQFTDHSNEDEKMHRPCAQWNTYFYDNLSELKEKHWKTENLSSVGNLWIEFLRFYTERFDFEEQVVTIRQKEILLKEEKGWTRPSIAIEDPFELTHNLATGLSMRNWTLIRRVFLRTREKFSEEHSQIDFNDLETKLLNIYDLCPENAPARCPLCHGPHHLRKYCPKSIRIANQSDSPNSTEQISEISRRKCFHCDMIMGTPAQSQQPTQPNDPNASVLIADHERELCRQQFMNLTKLNSDASHRIENEVYTRSQGIKGVYLRLLQQYAQAVQAKIQNRLNQQNPSGSVNVQGGGTAVATATTTTIRPSQTGAMLNQMSHPDPRFALNRNPTVSPRMINPQTQQTMNRLPQPSMNPRPMTVTTTTVSPTTNVTATQPTLINNPSNIDHIRANFPSQSMNNNNFNDYLTFQPRFPTPVQTNPARPRLPTNTVSFSSSSLPPTNLNDSLQNFSNANPSINLSTSSSLLSSNPNHMQANDNLLSSVLRNGNEALQTRTTVTMRPSTSTMMPQTIRGATPPPTSVNPTRPVLSATPSVMVIPPSTQTSTVPLATNVPVQPVTNINTNHGITPMAATATPVNRPVAPTAPTLRPITNPDAEVINLIKFLKENVDKLQLWIQKMTQENNLDRLRAIQEMLKGIRQFITTPTYEALPTMQKYRDFLEKMRTRTSQNPNASASTNAAPSGASAAPTQVSASSGPAATATSVSIAAPGSVPAPAPAPPIVTAPLSVPSQANLATNVHSPVTTSTTTTTTTTVLPMGKPVSGPAPVNVFDQCSKSTKEFLSRGLKERRIIGKRYLEPLNDVINGVPHKIIRLDADQYSKSRHRSSQSSPSSFLSCINDEINSLPSEIFSIERLTSSRSAKSSSTHRTEKTGLTLRCKLLGRANPIVPPLLLHVSSSYPQQAPVILSLTKSTTPQLDFAEGNPYFEKISSIFVSHLFSLPPEHTISDILTIWRQSVQAAS